MSGTRLKVKVGNMSEEFAEPLITIGIPVKNSAWSIREVLSAIEDLEYSKNRVKLVFVDDHSTDGTFEIISEWTKSVSHQYYDSVLIQESTNIPKARNLCIERFEGDYMLFWDSDVIPPRNLLRQMVTMLETERSLGMIGADYLHRKQDKQVGVYGKVMTSKRTHAVWMGFTLIRRDLFELIGGFNELLDIGEDAEYGIRAAEKTDFKTIWGPQPVLHLRPPTGKKSSDRRFTQWLSYNFRERGDKYAKTFHQLPMLLRMRIFYYGALPFALALSLILAYWIGLLTVLIFVAYLLPGWYMAVHGSNLRRGTLSFFLFNVPTGIVLSYGVLRHVLRHSEK